jgi:hypothetical protein
MHAPDSSATHPLTAAPSSGRESVVGRLRRGLAEAGLDGRCREAAEGTLDRIEMEEDFILRANGLADARRMRDAIVAALSLLGELDGLTPDEPDRTAFLEIADLFRDIADFAAFGVLVARRAAGGNG